MFNTKPLLKGNPVETVKISPDSLEEVTYTSFVSRSVPTWLSYDKDMSVHNYNYSPQDTSKIMKVTTKPFTKDDVDEDYLKGVYYGKEQISNVDGTNVNYILEGGVKYYYGGDWSSNIKDNPSSKLSFEKLKDVTTIDELKQSMLDLIGVKLHYPCGTCTDVINSLSFTGSAEGISVSRFENYMYGSDYNSNINLNEVEFKFDFGDGKGEIPLVGYFNAIDKFYELYQDDDDDKLIEKENTLSRLADAMAKSLRDRSYNGLSASVRRVEHFDRVLKPSDDPYSLIVYDYRDKDKMTSYVSKVQNVTNTSLAEVTTNTVFFREGEEVPVEKKLNIMCGAVNSSYISLDLPDISLDKISLDDYRVDRYYTHIESSYNLDEEEKKAYDEQLAKWKASAHEVTHSGKRTVKKLESYTPPEYKTYTVYNDGEKSTYREIISPGKAVYSEEEQDFYYTTTEYDGPMPVPPASKTVNKIVKSYVPSSLDAVDDAIEKVSLARTKLGAQQNRLEYAYNINNNTSENTDATESRIRDTDMSKEMVNYSKHNILEQVGQSMISQANQTQQGVLSILG